MHPARSSQFSLDLMLLTKNSDMKICVRVAYSCFCSLFTLVLNKVNRFFAINLVKIGTS